MSVALRPYQVRGLEDYEAAVAAKKRRILLVLPTGAGKTSLVAEIILRATRRGQRTLFVAHRREIIFQAYARFLAMGHTEEEVAILMASDKRQNAKAPVQVASIDTLRNRRLPAADLVVRDECHRALSPTDTRVRDAYPTSIHLGLTATPMGSSGKGLGRAYEQMLVVAQPRELANEGFLDTPHIYTVPPAEQVNLQGVAVRQSDFKTGELEERVNTSALVGNIVEHWTNLASTRRTLVFATTVAHSQHIVERFTAAGIAAEHVDANTPKDERAAAIARLEAGAIKVLSNVGLFTEGTDLPWVKCIVLARPTKSLSLYLQMCGRGLRPWGDERCVILDHAGCVDMHWLPLAERLWSLAPGKPAASRSNDVSPVTCPECYAVVERSAVTCPSCDHAFRTEEEEGPSKPSHGEGGGQLVEVTDGTRLAQAYARFVRIALLRGYKTGWAYHKFFERYKVQPPWEVGRHLKTLPLSEIAQQHFDSLLAKYGGDRDRAERTYFVEIQRSHEEHLSLPRAPFGFLPFGGASHAL
jgi:DNA repair protein RadD